MLYELHDQPSLEDPVMVMVLEGWIDAGYAATTAAQTLLGGIDSYPVATFDTDTLLDHRARRPVMHLVDGVNTGLSWPSLELRAGVDEAGNDLLLLLGAELDSEIERSRQLQAGMAAEEDLLLPLRDTTKSDAAEEAQVEVVEEARSLRIQGLKDQGRSTADLADQD